MIVGAAVCPGAPFLVNGVADALDLRFAEVGAACKRALDALPAADSLVILAGAGRSLRRSTGAPAGVADGKPGGSTARWLRSGSVLRSAGIVRTDHAAITSVELAPGGGAEATEPATGTVVAAHLLADAGITVPTSAVEIDGDPDQVAAELAEQAGAAARVALLVIADGSACHGDAAPGRRDDRAGPFDERIALAIAQGSATALAAACADRELGTALLAGVDPLMVLARITAGRPPSSAELLYSGAPMGVGYFVGCWRWLQGGPT